MKYLITENQFDNIVFKYLDNQDFKNVFYGHNIYFVNSEKDEFAQIKFNYTSKWCTISLDLMIEIGSFFSLNNNDSLSVISNWVKHKLNENTQVVDAQREIVVYFY